VKVPEVIGTERNRTMAKQHDEEVFEKYLENHYNAGTLSQSSKMKLLEDFRSARAQRRASTYAIYAAIAAVISTAVAVGSLVISIIALHSK
jgi:hypothetical protein